MSNGHIATDIEQVSKCVKCFLLGTDHVPSAGSLTADLFIVTKEPTKTDLRNGELLSGYPGELLDGMLAEIPLGREDVYIGGTVKCKPRTIRVPGREEVDRCTETWLRQEIKTVSPKVLLLLGSQAWKIVPKKWHASHGKVIRTKSMSFIFWYHPVFYLSRVDLKGFLSAAQHIKKELER